MANQMICSSLADIFSVYPQIFQKIVQTREKITNIFLPSDTDWQEKMYYRLLEVQKRVNEEAMECEVEITEKKRELILFDPTRIIQKLSPSISPNGGINDERPKCYSIFPTVDIKANTVWTLPNIAKAAKLLRKPPMNVNFENEPEMRRVYSLIYDVFRYKMVLSNALKDVAFFETFPEYKMDQSRIWLMLFELYHRNFKQRNSEDLLLQTDLYCDANVADVAKRLWKYRVPLAASISKMRINSGALQLAQLLPIHLRNEKVAIAALSPVITGWINPFALRDRTITDAFLAKMDLTLQELNCNQPLKPGEYIWDNICPLFTSCIPNDINEFSRSELMAGKLFVMQDKTFGYGPAMMSNLLDYFELDGDILQTHIASPRSTAYLASLIHSANRVNTFYVYGAGSHLNEYKTYMENLGITNIRLFAESFTSISIESTRFGSVVGIFANPPNSFSAVSDPIDFICSRGGDLSMLEILTEFEINDDGKRRVTLILEEQLLTLQLAMSRPQIQFVLYQTHSLLNAENRNMVRYVMDLVNGSSLEKHRRAYRERKRIEALLEAEAANIPSAALNVGSPRKRPQNPAPAPSATTTATATATASTTVGVSPGSSTGAVAVTVAGTCTGTGASVDDPKSKTQLKENATIKCESSAISDHLEDTEENISLPDCDEFVAEDIPDICLNQDKCLKLAKSGSYLCLIKRKSITRLNAKYLIKMAEIRGLFGRGDIGKTAKPKTLKTQDTTLQKPSKMNLLDTAKQKKSLLDVDSLITRLNTHTNASSLRTHLDKMSSQNQPLKFNCKGRECRRYRSMSIISKPAKPSKVSKILWRNAFLCIKKTKIGLNAAWYHFSAYRDCYKMDLTSLQRKLKFRRQPYPIHVQEIKLLLKKQII